MGLASSKPRASVLLAAGAGIAIILLLILNLAIPGSYLGVRTKTVTSTVTVMPTQQVVEAVVNNFNEHLDTFASENVSGILSEYSPTANVTWLVKVPSVCLNGTFTVVGDKDNFTEELNTLFARPNLGFQSIIVGNVTAPSTRVTNDIVTINSSFDLLARTYGGGNFSATISAQDSYIYGSNGVWLIAQETWQFLQTQYNFALCGY